MIQEPNLAIEALKMTGFVLLCVFAAVGLFACVGGVMQAYLHRRRTSALERDIYNWEKLKRKYNHHAEKK